MLDPEDRQIPAGTSDADRETYFDPILMTDETGAPWLVDRAEVAAPAARVGVGKRRP